MIEPTVINTAAAAFAAGLATSAHCVGMCGPLACLGGASGQPRAWSRALGTAGYHAGRIASYASLGALAGWLGRAPLEAVSAAPARLLPWALALGLVGIAFGWERKIPRPRRLDVWLFRARLALGRQPHAVGRTILGLATPLLPCAPLYIMVGVALLSGSAGAGAGFTAAFALGTIPLLLLAGGAFSWISGRFGPESITGMRRGIALLAAAAIVLRMSTGSPLAAPDPICPLCP